MERTTKSVWVGATPAGDFGPQMCEVSSVGARQRTRGCSPRGLGGVFALVQGLYTSSCLVALLGGRPASFSAGIGTLSAALGILSAGTVTRLSA